MRLSGTFQPSPCHWLCGRRGRPAIQAEKSFPLAAIAGEAKSARAAGVCCLGLGALDDDDNDDDHDGLRDVADDEDDASAGDDDHDDDEEDGRWCVT